MIQSVAFVAALVFPALVLFAAVRDAATYTIPNWISLTLTAVFPLAALAAGAPLGVIGLHLAIGAAGLAIGVAMFSLRWIGGGDAKLFAAVALWLGWPASLQFMMWMAIAGGALSLGILLLRSDQMRPFALLGPGWVARMAEPTAPIPYGLAIAVGALAAFPASLMARGLPF